jgi:hypothetical protein
MYYRARQGIGDIFPQFFPASKKEKPEKRKRGQGLRHESSGEGEAMV